VAGAQCSEGADDALRHVEELLGDTETGLWLCDTPQAALDRHQYLLNARGVEPGSALSPPRSSATGRRFHAVRHPELYYQPTAHPGACLSHIWPGAASSRSWLESAADLARRRREDRR
jgi:2,4-dichlorophenol 6-monooxygenase